MGVKQPSWCPAKFGPGCRMPRIFRTYKNTAFLTMRAVRIIYVRRLKDTKSGWCPNNFHEHSSLTF
jgi:hypothetical protein